MVWLRKRTGNIFHNDTIRNRLIEYPYIQQVYKLYDAEHKIENVHAHYLKLDSQSVNWNPAIDESFVKILPPDELRGYTPKSPDPKDILISDKAIIDYLNLKITIDEIYKLIWLLIGSDFGQLPHA